MALGDSIFNRQNNNRNTRNRVNVNSSFRFTNNGDKDNNMAPTGLNISYWSDLMKLSIAPLKKSSQADFMMYDRDNEVAIYLTPTKAHILSNEIKRVISGEVKSSGVVAGHSFINISDGSSEGLNNPVISIRKFNNDLSAIESNILYLTKSDIVYAIHNFSEKEMDGTHDMETYKFIELENIAMICEEFYRAMSHATAYSVIDRQEFANYRINAAIMSLAEAGGMTQGKQNNTNNSNGFNDYNAPHSKGTLEDL